MNDPLVGQVLSGYRVERLLGRGGMGSVYLARHAIDGLPVVLKFLEAGFQPQLAARFRREGEVLQRLPPHPYVVGILGFFPDGPHPFLVMEFVEGLSLLGLIQQQGRVAPAEAGRIVHALALGLAAIHDHGMIHRDVKPENVVLMRNGAPKLVDFGVAKDHYRTSLTMANQLVGTAPYMAPELWEGKRPTPASDVFALGGTLYALLCGRPPFEDEDLGELADMISAGDYEPPRAVAPGVPLELERVVIQMLAPNPRYRYARMPEVAADLERVLRGEPCGIPCLVEVSGARHVLLPKRWFTLGSDAVACQVPLTGEGIAAQHAQVRREANGYVLNDLGTPGGTFVNEEQVPEERPLVDGDQVRVGPSVTLTFRDPRAAAAQPGAVRAEYPAPVVEALIGLGDARCAAVLLERLTPDPLADRRAERELVGLFGPELAQATLAHRAHEQGQRRAAVPQQLATISGQPVHVDPQAWLRWWERARHSAPPQLGPAGGAPRARLARINGPESLELSGADLVRIGRDDKCDLRIDDRTVSRLHASLLRLHTRWVVRDESKHGIKLDGAKVRLAFLDHNRRLKLGDVELTLDVEDAPAPGGAGPHPIDPASYWVLEAQGHASVVAALVGFLASARGAPWIADTARRLGSEPLRERLQAGLAQRGAAARQLLPALLGADVGDDPAAWQRLLHERRPHLPPQVVPRGWLT